MASRLRKILFLSLKWILYVMTNEKLISSLCPEELVTQRESESPDAKGQAWESVCDCVCHFGSCQRFSPSGSSQGERSIEIKESGRCKSKKINVMQGSFISEQFFFAILMNTSLLLNALETPKFSEYIGIFF